MDMSTIYGSMVFNDYVMQQKLPHETYRTLKRILRQGGSLDKSIADIIANAMKDWAIEKGATHFTHWFQPMTGITAEKHDSFITPVGDGAIMEFSGKELINGESDASSFPSGGLRATFEARGYTAWDPTSYAFIKEKTLCIPTAFCSYTGEALDKKTPLLRSMELINSSALKLLKLFDKKAERVIPTVGAEQEYFLIDKSVYDKRPDLKYTGRTLFGRQPSKGQELDDHFSGALKTRVSEFMHELDYELWKLGIPAKTCHNEAAPAQHELALVYETVNIAVDHNQLTMEIMKKLALKHNLVCLLHEKPFEGVNGSGKHNNWSLATDDGTNLLDPGDNPKENYLFLVMLCAVIAAVDKHQDLLRISVASAGNDHRLGGYEAPPAIISMYLGEELTDILLGIARGFVPEKAEKTYINSGVHSLSMVRKDTTDRNRTSPFAFTGNKFEFRSVGASFSISDANVVINTIVADSLQSFADRLEKAENLISAVNELIKDTVNKHGRIVFNGNNYSDEWVEEAARRGLINLHSTVDAYEMFATEKNIALFTKHGIFSESEIYARREIMLENYSKIVNIEALTMIDMLRRNVMPCIFDYIGRLSADINAASAAGCAAKSLKKLLNDIERKSDAACGRLDALINAQQTAAAHGLNAEAAPAFKDSVLPAMALLRHSIDELEGLMPEADWPYPSYGEIMFSVS